MATEKESYEPITCIVCEQPYPAKKYESEADPDYFPVTSGGYIAGDEGTRACEDISQLLRYATTVNSAIWDNFTHRDITDKVNALHVQGVAMQEEDHYTDAARDLCFLFRELLAETKRRFTLMDKWITKQWQKDQGEEVA